MADISITAANVKTGTGAAVTTGTAGGTITAGQPVYIDASDSNKIKAADANASAATAAAVGIALNGASANQPVSYCTRDSAGFTVGATLAIGDVLYVSNTAGGITVTPGDLTTGSYVVVLGIMTSTTLAKIQPLVGGQKA